MTTVGLVTTGLVDNPTAAEEAAIEVVV